MEIAIFVVEKYKDMKKIVSTQGMRDGFVSDIYLNAAIRERINHKLEYYYDFQDFTEGTVHVDSALSYELVDGEVKSILLSFMVDNPTRRRLEDFRVICEWIFEMNGLFVVDENTEHPSVCCKATDIYDMACLIHALEFQSVSLQTIMCAIDDSQSIEDVVNSLDDDAIVEDEDNVEEDDEEIVFDKDMVGYSIDGKILKGCHHLFNKIRYEVPDGVEEIADFAFLWCRHFVELSIPRSVRIIGDQLFGVDGGVIKKRATLRLPRNIKKPCR